MAKMNMTVDNGLEDVKLKSVDEMKRKKDNKKDNKKEKKEKKPSTKKNGYLKEVVLELNRVSWPTKKNLVKYSFATIGMIIILSVYFIGLSALFDLLYNLVQGWIN